MEADFSPGRLDEAFAAWRNVVKAPNVMVTGGTGVGKSSLINYVFGEEMAEAGTGRPVTDKITRYSSPTVPVSIYDTPGYTLGEDFSPIVEFIEKRQLYPRDAVHVVWYCINAGRQRITDFDLNNVGELTAQAPVAVVLTQIDRVSAEQFTALEASLEDHLPTVPRFKTSIKALPFEDDTLALIRWSREMLPRAFHEALVAAQRRDLLAKQQFVAPVVRDAAIAAFAAGVQPLPVVDVADLWWIHRRAMARIRGIYGLSVTDMRQLEAIWGPFWSALVRSLAGYVAIELAKALLPEFDWETLPFAGVLDAALVWTSLALWDQLCYGRALASLRGDKDFAPPSMSEAFFALLRRFADVPIPEGLVKRALDRLAGQVIGLLEQWLWDRGMV